MAKLNLEKMRRGLARDVSDAVWRTFNFMDEREYVHGYDEWCAWFARMMRYKHGNNFRGFTAFVSDIEAFGAVRAQLVAQLYDPTLRPGSRRSRRINVVYEENKRTIEKELLTPLDYRKRLGLGA